MCKFSFRNVFLPVLISASLFLLAGCTASNPLYSRPEDTQGTPRIREPEKLGIVCVNTSLYRLTTGGVPEKDFGISDQVRGEIVSEIGDRLETHLTEDAILFPVSGIQEDINNFAPVRSYMEATVRGINQMYIRRRRKKLLDGYVLHPRLKNVKKEGFTHLIFFGAEGYFGSSGYQAVSWTRAAVGFLLGQIMVPVLDAGYMWVAMADLELGEITYFNTNLPTTRNVTLTDQGEREKLIDVLLQPILESWENTGK